MYRQNETELRRAMDRLERWFAEHVDEPYFAPGASDAVGPLASFLARWNGQRDDAAVPFFEAFHLLDAESCAREKAMMDGLASEEGWPASWWDPDWVPFASDGCGQLLVLDVRSGAVIEFIHDDEPRPVHAETLEAFLAAYADALEHGQRDLRDGYIVDLDEHAAALARAEEREAARQQGQAQAKRTLVWTGAMLLGLVALIVLLSWAFGHR
ncbi:MAG: hypothetical protein EVA89_05745 [Sandaracinaceae bacterium]|nr:MAG: hypothetical protein EVA89_05745 [Sandaracinaceae bacterium]